MYFEDDEKDNIEDIDTTQDDSISWNGILDTDEDGVVSIRDGSLDDESTNETPVQVFANDSDDVDMEALNGIVEGVGDDSAEEEVDEEEIRRILNENNGGLNNASVGNSSAAQDFSDSDLDFSQPTDDISPRKNERKSNTNKKGTSPVLLVLLVCLAILGGVYFYMSSSSGGKDDMIQPQAPQEPMQTPETESDEEEAQEPETEAAIPVVNEEDVSDLKPDEEEAKDEKKEVVSIVPTGRPNPFMPVSKYVPKVDLITKTLNSIDFNSVNIPKPPTEYGTISEFTDKLMSISVSGIMYDKYKPSAIITFEDNDYFVQVGDKLDNFKVVEIGPTYVKIALGNNIYKANVGEEFIIKNEFYGVVPYKNGGRQYYSSEDTFSNGKPVARVDYSIGSASSRGANRPQVQNQGYTDERDVKINTVDKSNQPNGEFRQTSGSSTKMTTVNVKTNEKK